MTQDTGTARTRYPHVVVVGDVILDRDVVGRTDRIAPDAPVPVLDVTSERETAGGAGLAALLAASSKARVSLIAPIARDAGGTTLRALLEPHLDLIPIGHQGPTRRKTRVRSGGQSLLRIDDGGPGLPMVIPDERIRATLAAADVVLVADYGAGTTTDPQIRAALEAVAGRVRMVWDPHPRGGAPVRRCSLVTPNLAEATTAGRELSDGGVGDRPDVLAGRLRTAWSVDAVCVTAGAEGAFLAASGPDTQFFPAPRVRAGDTCGAGDRFAASAAVSLGRGGLTSEAVARGVADASAWVGAGGSACFRMQSASTGDEQSAPGAGQRTQPVPANAPRAETLEELAGRLRGGGTLVATGGCFDIVHAGHVATLQAARRLGDALVVLMNSDASVTRLKGPGRPVIGAADRARVLEAFDCVDAVAVFDDDDPRAALSRLRPDIWVKGGDYGGTPLPETATVQAGGGSVVFLPYLNGRSTTGIIERSRSQTEPAGPGQAIAPGMTETDVSESA